MRRRRSGRRLSRALSMPLCMASAFWLAGCDGAGGPDGTASGAASAGLSSAFASAPASAAVPSSRAAATPDAGAARLGEANMPAMGRSSGVFYEIFVRAFSDSDGDGIGDLQGVTDKLDYLQQLGIKGIWLMPINPSPSYHGYDVTDYYAVNPDYGTVDDLKTLLAEAHDRGIRVIMDLVLNHTSSKHPWFIESVGGKKAPSGVGTIGVQMERTYPRSVRGDRPCGTVGHRAVLISAYSRTGCRI